MAVGNLNVKDVVADSNGTNSGGSFASLLKPKDATNKVHFRTLVNDERIESIDCVLPRDAAAKIKGRYENSIVGFFLGKDPSFPVVQQNGFSLLCTQIGNLSCLKCFTSSMCVESWGRISFARALIEIDAAAGLKKEVTMAIPVDEGDGHIKETVRRRFLNIQLGDGNTTLLEENDDGVYEDRKPKKKNWR
ncbi:hypothetical protein Tco_1121189 [Tanacetum coccineum]|uniref:Uncharacterized protein n=1 Tax=Tanacetum coccineum TaxID=301880 RepID=A0ABQ5IX64_9ASTR